MKLVIEVELGNEAMTPREVDLALTRAMHEQVAWWEPFEVGQSGAVRDRNGNTVGKWEVA